MLPQDEEDEEELDGDKDEGGGGGEGGPVTSAIIADPASNLEIAWENLGLARAILSCLVDGIVLTSYDDEYKDKNDNAKNNEYGGRSGKKVALKSDNINNDDKEEAGGGGTPTTAEELKNKLLLDLAQVHVRLGDNVLSCLDDYDSALRLRLRVLGKYVKKVTDVTSD